MFPHSTLNLLSVSQILSVSALLNIGLGWTYWQQQAATNSSDGLWRSQLSKLPRWLDV